MSPGCQGWLPRTRLNCRQQAYIESKILAISTASGYIVDVKAR
jgi:hypothetical protein